MIAEDPLDRKIRMTASHVPQERKKEGRREKKSSYYQSIEVERHSPIWTYDDVRAEDCQWKGGGGLTASGFLPKPLGAGIKNGEGERSVTVKWPREQGKCRPFCVSSKLVLAKWFSPKLIRVEISPISDSSNGIGNNTWPQRHSQQQQYLPQQHQQLASFAWYVVGQQPSRIIMLQKGELLFSLSLSFCRRFA